MRILTLGGGTVGRWIADMLCRRRHSVTLIDSDPEIVRTINNELDVRAMEGNASQSTVLFAADVLSADLCLALTGNDEVNIVAASMAKQLGARRTVARVYSPALRDLATFDYQQHFGIDSLLSLEQLSGSELARAIRNPDAIPLEHFARGQLQVYEMVVAPGASAAGQKLTDLDLPPGVRIGSLAREGRMWIASGADETHVGDRVSLVGMPEAIAVARKVLGGERRARKKTKVMIAGGGEIGYHLINLLGKEDFRVVLLETERHRCEQLAKLLPHITVVQANANRRSVLEDEGGGAVDFFVACTGNDENNIMAGVEARELGASRVMCVVGRPDYANVVGKLGIDLAVSERDVAARQVLGLLNEGAVISQAKLPNGSIGVYELEVMPGSPITQASLANLPLAGRCLIAAIQRDGFVRVPTADDVLEVGDIIVALIDLVDTTEILQLFNPSEAFRS